MAVAIIYTELDIDLTKFQAKQKKLLSDIEKVGADSETALQRSFMNLGVTSDSVYKLMVEKVRVSYEQIAQSGKASAAEQVRAQQAMVSQINAINAKMAEGANAHYATLGMKSAASINEQIANVQKAATAQQLIVGKSSDEWTRIEKAKNEKLKELNKEMTGEHEMSMASMTRAVLRVYAAYYILSQAAQLLIAPIKMAITYLATIETATLGIAASFMTGGKFIDQTTGKVLEGSAALAKAQVMSKELIKELQYANLQTIATLDQLIVAYQATLPVALAKGFNVKQVKDFTLAMVQAAGAIGLPMDQMAEETRSLLTGSINPRNSRIATVLGLRNEDIAKYKSDAQGLFDFLMNKLDAYKVAGIEAQNTWAGLTSNMKDIAGQFFGRAFDPLFEAMKYQMQEWIKDVVTLDEKTKTITWNKSFLDGIETIKGGITAIIAEMYRLGATLDLVGRGMAGAQMFLAGPGAALGIESSKKKFEAAAESYLDYGKRMLASDKALQDMAMRGQGFSPSTAGTKGAISVTTELGQILFYYKAINEEKTKYQVNPPKADTEKESTIRRNMLAAETALNKEYYDDAVAKSNHWLRMQQINGQGDLEATKKVIEDKKVALNVWYDAQAASINKYTEGATKKYAELSKLDKEYSKSWNQLVNEDSEVAAKITKKAVDDALKAMLAEIALGVKLTAASIVRIEAKDKAEKHSFEQYQKMMDANEDLALSDHQRAMNRIAAKAKAEKALIDLQVLAGKISPAQAEIDKTKIDSITGQQIAEELSKDAARIADFYSQITGYSDKYYNKKLEQIEAERKLNKVLYGEEMANAKAKQSIGELDQKMFTDKSEQVSKALGDMSSAFTAIGSMYDKNSSEYARMQEAAKAMIVLQQAVAVANAVAAIANQASGDPYTAFARIAAMIAAMAGLLGSSGIAFSGGSSGSAGGTALGGNTTVLGGKEGQGSESIANSYKLMQDTYTMEDTKLTGIWDAMKALNDSILGLVNSIVRTGGIGNAGSFGVDLSDKSDWRRQLWDKSGITGLANIMQSPIEKWLNGILGSIGEAIFGGKTTSWVGTSGLSFGKQTAGELIGGSQISGKSYAEIGHKTSGGLVGSDSYSYETIYKDLDASVSKLFTDVFKNLSLTLVELSKGLGTDVQAALDYTFGDIKINLQDLDAAGIDKAINEFISNAGDMAVDALFGQIVKGYQKIGEGLLETAIRLVIDKEVVLNTLKMTNQSFTPVPRGLLGGPTAIEQEIAFAEALIEIAGGLDKLTEAASTYYAAFFSDAEKAADNQKQLTDALKDQNLVLPSTRDGYRDLVEGLDLNTEAGMKAYVMLLQLSGGADAYYKGLEEKAKKLLDERTNIQDQIDQLTMSATDLLNKQRDALDESNQALFDQLVALQKANAIAEERKGLQEQLNALTDTSEEALRRQRAALDESNKALFDQIQVEKARAAALTKATADAVTQGDLMIQYLKAVAAAGGGPQAERAAQRALELEREKILKSYGDNQALIDLQKAIWGLNDAAEAAAKALATANKTQDLYIQLLQAQGRSEEALAEQRKLTLAGLDNDEQRRLQQAIWDLADAAAKLAKAIEEQNKTADLFAEYQRARGATNYATSYERSKAISLLSGSIDEEYSQKWLQDQIYKLGDAATAAAARLEIANQKQDLDIQLMEAMGDKEGALAARRADALKAMDWSLRAEQQHIWALQDQAAAAQAATDALSKYIDKLRNAKDAMKIDDGTAGTQRSYALARADIAAVLQQARGGDLTGIGGLDKTLGVLTSATPDMYGSREAYQRDFWTTYQMIAELEKLAGARLPGYADGGIASGPSGGYNATLHGTELIISPRTNYPATVKGGDNVVMIEELRKLREEIRQVGKNTKDTANNVKVLNEWDAIGIPATQV